MLPIYLVIVHILTSLGSATSEGIETSKLFVVPVKSEMFNWGTDAKHDQYLYQSSLLDAPDLPPWIRYTYSKRYHHGFLYGVPPADQDDFQLEIVGLNKHTYETRYKILNVNVARKEDPAKREVQLKIDNLNVEDMFDKNRTQSLLDIFRTNLWTDATDLYVTFMASAIEMGARLPLKPGEGDGVVVRLGSVVAFSQKMHTLQDEVKPLWKLSSCPRDFKKTSVEILFRSEGFLLDWCSFRLIEEDHRLHQESARRDPNLNVIGLPSAGLSGHTEWRWSRPSKAGIPKRSYFKEMATTVLIPATLLVVLAGFLSATLCWHHDKVPKRDSLPVEGLGNNSEVQMVQYASSQRGGTLRSLSAQPSSPSDSLTLSPRTSTERCVPYMRPSPPPYMRPQNALGGNRTDF